MLARVIREAKARMVVLVVDDSGMSTVEYPVVGDYTRQSRSRLNG